MQRIGRIQSSYQRASYDTAELIDSSGDDFRNVM
jgi:hypothetical protein